MTEKALKNRRILIRDIENGQTIADTKIIRYDSAKNAVYIGAGTLREMKFYNISAFIFARKCLYEFFGTTRGVLINNEIEVLLGKNREKEDRVRTRYPVILEGSIDSIIIENRKIQLRKFIYIQTINMSANGILMKADSGSFVIGDCFSVNLKIEDGEIRLNCKIVRIQNSSLLTEEYGCRITEIWIDRKNLQENVI